MIATVSDWVAVMLDADGVTVTVAFGVTTTSDVLSEYEARNPPMG
jgi:hypothetical protein